MANRSDSEVADICEMTAMASLVGDLIIAALEFVVWAVWELLPLLCYFTGLVLVFAVTFGKVAVELPRHITEIGWTGLLRVTRLPEGQTILSPALGVIIGFMIWAAVASVAIIFHAYRA